MSWEKVKERLYDTNILWDLPKPSDLEPKLPVEGRKRIDHQDNRTIRKELREHWMQVTTREMIENYRAELIAEQVGLVAQRETDDFDQIIEEHADSTGDRVNMRLYITLSVFDESDLHRPWEQEEEP